MLARNGYNNNDGDDRINQLRNQIRDIPNINQGINKRNEEIHHQGYIDNKKMIGSMRILQLNPHGFGLEMNEKINILKEAIISMEIDVILLSARINVCSCCFCLFESACTISFTPSSWMLLPAKSMIRTVLLLVSAGWSSLIPERPISFLLRQRTSRNFLS